jgi:hypothetical protein
LRTRIFRNCGFRLSDDIPGSLGLPQESATENREERKRRKDRGSRKDSAPE